MFYIYEHVRKDTGQVFYVGKGQGKRAYHFYDRNPHWNNIANKCGGIDVQFFATDIADEKEAYRIEIDRIAELKDLGVELSNISDGGEGFMSGEAHPYYGQDKEDWYKAKIKLANLLSQGSFNVKPNKSLSDKSMSFTAYGGRVKSKGKHDNLKILGSTKMKHEAIKLCEIENARLIRELSDYIAKVEQGITPKVTYDEICNVKITQPTQSSARLLKNGRQAYQRSRDKAWSKGDEEQANYLTDILLEVEELLFDELYSDTPNDEIPTLRSYEEEINLNYALAQTCLERGMTEKYEQHLANIIFLENELEKAV